MVPDQVLIRSARAADAQTIRALVRGARLDPTQLHWPQFLIAEVAGEVVGIGQLRRYGRVQELGSLVVVAAWQGKGVGGCLVRALIARRDGEVFLECRKGLARYYEQYGFEQVPWHCVPWPLRAKFAFSSFFSAPFGGVATMQYRGQ